jgi:hypothetical protein
MRPTLKTLFLATLSLTVAGAFLPPAAGAEEMTPPVQATTTGQPAAAPVSGYDMQLITASNMYYKYPKINNAGSLVWQAKVGKHFQIFYITASEETPRQLTDNALDNTDPRINDRDEIVWMGGDKTHSDIFMYAKGVVTRLTANTLMNQHPKLNNIGEVVWIAGVADSEGKVANYETFHYADGIIEQVTNNNKFNVQVRINDAGTMMWRGKGETNFDIFTRTAGVSAQITADAGLDVNPQISNNGHMVWERNDGKDDEIVLKLRQAATPVQITTNNANDCEPQVNDQGTVVWQGHDGSHWQIFMYADGVTTKLTDGTLENTEPRLNAAGDIAWMIHDTDGIGISVYQAATKTIRKISSSYVGHYSQMVDINDQGQVVWAGSNGKNFDILMATPQ